MDLSATLNGIVGDLTAARDELASSAITAPLAAQVAQGLQPLVDVVPGLMANQAALPQWGQAAQVLVGMIQQSGAPLSPPVGDGLQRAGAAARSLTGDRSGLVLAGLAAVLGLSYWAYSSMKRKEFRGESEADEDEEDPLGLEYHSKREVLGDDVEELDVEDVEDEDDNDSVDDAPNVWKRSVRKKLKWGSKEAA